MSQKSAKNARRDADARARTQTYALTPARGQALLNYQGRLRAAKMPAFDTDLVETVRPKTPALATQNQWRDKLLQGDCLSACAWMRQNNIAADLVYIDPPFASGANYAKKILLRRPDAAQLQNGDNALGEEVVYNDIWQKEDYLNWLYERLLAVREIMAETASIYLHLDWHIGHYAKILMDEVFGEENFRNEIIWFYHDSPGRGKDCFPRKHDTLLYYAKSAEFIFNNDDVRVEILGRSKERYKTPRKLGGREYVGGEASEKGKIPEDVWTIPVVKGNSDERTDYVTQKPEALLNRVIQASSNEGDLVADFFCGSGTTARAAHKLGRRFIVGDIGVNGVQTTRDGLRETGATFDIMRIRDGVRLFRNPAQTEARVFSLMPDWRSRKDLGLGESWDGGIALSNGAFAPVKFAGIGTLLTRQMLQVVLEEAAQLGDAGRETPEAVALYAHKEDDVDQAWADREARQHPRTDLRLRLMSLDELLAAHGGAFYPEDSADVSAAKTAKGWRVRIRAFYSPYLKAKLDDYNERRRTGKVAEKTPPPLKTSERGLELLECAQFDFRGAEVADGTWQSDLEDRPRKAEAVRGEYEIADAAAAKGFRMKLRSVAGDELILSSNDIIGAEKPGAKKTSAKKASPKKRRKRAL